MTILLIVLKDNELFQTNCSFDERNPRGSPLSVMFVLITEQCVYQNSLFVRYSIIKEVPSPSQE